MTTEACDQDEHLALQVRCPGSELAERAGHARPSMSLDVYSQVMPPDEIDSERFLSLLSDG